MMQVGDERFEELFTSMTTAFPMKANGFDVITKEQARWLWREAVFYTLDYNVPKPFIKRWQNLKDQKNKAEKELREQIRINKLLHEKIAKFTKDA